MIFASSDFLYWLFIFHYWFRLFISFIFFSFHFEMLLSLFSIIDCFSRFFRCFFLFAFDCLHFLLIFTLIAFLIFLLSLICHVTLIIFRFFDLMSLIFFFLSDFLIFRLSSFFFFFFWFRFRDDFLMPLLCWFFDLFLIFISIDIYWIDIFISIFFERDSAFMMRGFIFFFFHFQIIFLLFPFLLSFYREFFSLHVVFSVCLQRCPFPSEIISSFIFHWREIYWVYLESLFRELFSFLLRYFFSERGFHREIEIYFFWPFRDYRFLLRVSFIDISTLRRLSFYFQREFSRLFYIFFFDERWEYFLLRLRFR